MSPYFAGGLVTSTAGAAAGAAAGGGVAAGAGCLGACADAANANTTTDADASVRIFPYAIMLVLPGANDFRKANCGKRAKWCAWVLYLSRHGHVDAHARNSTSAALAAGTFSTGSPSLRSTASRRVGAQRPSSSTLALPSITPSVASIAGPARRSTEAAENRRPG